jgi:hypothetical protein
MPDRVKVVIKIFGSIALHTMILQESIQFPAGRDCQESAELVGGEAALAIGFEGERLQRGAGGVLAGGREGRGQLIGNIQRDPHRNQSITGAPALTPDTPTDLNRWLPYHK